MLIDFGNPDNYDTATHGLFWTTSGSPVQSGVRSDGYLGRPALTSFAGHTFLTKLPEWPPLWPSGTRDFRLGGRFKWEVDPGTDLNMILAAVDFAGNWQCIVTHNDDLTVSIWRGTYHEELARSTTTLPLDQFHRVGFKGTLHQSSGSAEVWLDHTVIVRASGNTTADGDIDNLSGYAIGLSTDCAVNHYYFGDSYGYQNDLLPALLVKIQFPANTHDLNTWAANTGTVHEAIDDAAPDGDTTTIAAVEDNSIFAVGVDTLAETHIHAVKTTALVQNASNPWAGHRLIVIQDGTVFDGAVHIQVDGGAHIYQVPIEGSFYRAISRMDYGCPRQEGEGWTAGVFNQTAFGGRAVV